MKPLNGFGGQGVIVIEKSARQNFKSLLDFYIGSGDASNYVILQEYVTGAENGDVRILMLNGEPIGAMRRVPAGDDVRSNIHAGGKEVKHVLTKEEKALCHAIGPQLVRDGLYFAGLDVINGKLIEVNVLSPGGITRINRLNRVKLQSKVLDFIENVVSAKELVLERSAFRKVIEDAETV
jgi:glutathione synthase